MIRSKTKSNLKGKSSSPYGALRVRKREVTIMNLTPWRRKEAEAGSAITPWVFRREFDDLVERFFGGEPGVSRGIFGRGFSPAVDMTENENEIIVTAEIPGMEQKDLDISLSGDLLTIKGEKKAEHEEKGEDFHLV
jgi:HSP20 family protein